MCGKHIGSRRRWWVCVCGAGYAAPARMTSGRCQSRSSGVRSVGHNARNQATPALQLLKAARLRRRANPDRVVPTVSRHLHDEDLTLAHERGQRLPNGSTRRSAEPCELGF